MKEDVSHKGPGYVLRNGGVKIHIISAERIEEAISQIVAEGL